MSKYNPYSLEMIPTEDLMNEIKRRSYKETFISCFKDNDPETPGEFKFFMSGNIEDRVCLIKYLDYVAGNEFLNSLNIYQ